MVAEAPMTAAALESGKKQKELQSYTKRVQKITGTEFVVVMDMNGIRKTHPDPSKIGKKFRGGDESEVLKGHVHISTARKESDHVTKNNRMDFAPLHNPIVCIYSYRFRKRSKTNEVPGSGA